MRPGNCASASWPRDRTERGNDGVLARCGQADAHKRVFPSEYRVKTPDNGLTIAGQYAINGAPGSQAPRRGPSSTWMTDARPSRRHWRLVLFGGVDFFAVDDRFFFALLRRAKIRSLFEFPTARMMAPSPAKQGRVGAGLSELASLLKYIARLLHPTPALPYYT